MKLKAPRASVARAKRYISYKGWHIDHDEVYTIDDTGQKDRIPLIQFCRRYAKDIASFIAGAKVARKTATIAKRSADA